MTEEVIVEIKKLTKKYKHNTALNNINLKLEKGKVYGFIGKNGAGENSIIVTDTIIKLNQGLKASTKFLNKMILI